MSFSATNNTSRSHLTKQSGTTPGEVYRSRVWEDLRNLFRQDHLTDVMLAAEGQSIPCHKVLLAAASKFFYDKFITNPESLDHNILSIDDIEFDTLTSAVAYIYSGEIELTVEKTEKLIPASFNLMLPELTKECENFIQTISTDTSVSVEIYRIARANSLESTAQKALKTALENFQEIFPTSAFKELSENELQEYIGDEKDLNVASEDPVFEAVVTWIKHDMNKRKDKFEKLLEYVTLSHCSLSFLKDVVMQESLMKRGNCIWRAAEALASHASFHSLQLGTPRNAQYSKTSLLAIYYDHFWVLKDSGTEWMEFDPDLVTCSIPYAGSACRTLDGILMTGGLTCELTDTINKDACKLSLPTLDCLAVSDLNVARHDHASVCVGEQVYVLGGYDGSDELQSVEYLDENTGSWSVTTDMPVGLMCHTAVNYKQYIYVFGGFQTQRSSFVLDTVSKEWSLKADMPRDCSSGSSILYRDRIYVLGNIENNCISYNPQQDQWQIHSSPRENHSPGHAVVWGGRLLLCGGDITATEEYNPHTGTWFEWKHSLPYKGCRGVFAVQL